MKFQPQQDFVASKGGLAFQGKFYDAASCSMVIGQWWFCTTPCIAPLSLVTKWPLTTPLKWFTANWSLWQFVTGREVFQTRQPLSGRRINAFEIVHTQQFSFCRFWILLNGNLPHFVLIYQGEIDGQHCILCFLCFLCCNFVEFPFQPPPIDIYL